MKYIRQYENTTAADNSSSLSTDIDRAAISWYS